MARLAITLTITLAITRPKNWTIGQIVRLFRHSDTDEIGVKARPSIVEGNFMAKIAPENMSFVGPSVHKPGFGVATFHIAPRKRREKKVPGIPAGFPPHLMAQGRKA